MTPERRHQIVCLLRTRRDARWEPPLSRAEQNAERGEVGSLKQPCPDCDGDGILLDKWKRPQPCTRCGGELVPSNEFIPFIPGRGWVKVDRYTGTEPRPSEDRSRGVAVRTVHCDRCGGEGVSMFQRCGLCGGSGRRELVGDQLRAAHTSPVRADERFNDPRLVGEQRWRAAGSYDPLDAALAKLANVSPVARHLVFQVFEDGLKREGDLPAALRRRLEMALRFLDRALPRRLRVPKCVLEAAARTHVSREQVERIRRLRFEEEWPIHRLIVSFGLSRDVLFDVLGRTG